MGLRFELIRHFWYEGVGLGVLVTERIEVEFLLEIVITRVKVELQVLGSSEGS